MGKAWGHEILSGHPALEIYKTCTARYCSEPSSYVAAYAYRTGRHRKVAQTFRAYCWYHARSFALNQGLDPPADDGA